VVVQGGERAPSQSPSHRKRAQTWLFAIALVALIVGTSAGVVLARERAVDDVQHQAQRAAENGAALLQIELRVVAAGLSGSAAVVGADGDLDVEVFTAFADDRLAGAEERELTLVDIVPAADRVGFEERLGEPIQTFGERGHLVVAPPAPVHFPVVSVKPDLSGRAAVGLDLGSDPRRRVVLEAAEQSKDVAVGAVVDEAGDGSKLMFVVRPLIGPNGEVAGFVGTGIPMARLQQTIESPAAGGVPVALVEGDTLISGHEIDDPDTAAAASVGLPQGDWRVLVDPAAGSGLPIAWLVGGGGGAAILTMAALVLLTERHQRRLARANALLEANQERGRAVQIVAGRLARALGGGDVAAALVDYLPAAVGARSAVVAILDRAGRLAVVERDADTPTDDALGRDTRLLPVPAVGSVVEGVLARREPAWLSSPLGWRGDETAAALSGDGSALAVLPLLAGEISGVLAVSYPQLHIFGEDEQALLQTVGVLAARALARGRRYDAEHEAAVAFQRSALPDALPEVDGASIAARYRPATYGATVGGDWYDVLVLDDDRILLVVGDVVGHGMVAAAAMGRLRTAFQTIVPFRSDPGSMLQAVGQQVTAIPDAFCTTVVSAALDLRSGELEWSRAGHPPPMVLGADGPSFLDAKCLPPLGVDAAAAAVVHRHVLDPGDLVVLYTDGLVERRGESLDEGFRRLGAIAEQLVDLDPEEFSDALVEALVPGEQQADDLAVLVVRFDGRVSAAG
jgi:serine phosphatase RsbU (regulator of sigma subunit)